MTDEYDTRVEVLTDILADPTSSDLSLPSVIDVRAIRKKAGLTQATPGLGLEAQQEAVRSYLNGGD
ncbi:MAG: hypothetical protein ABW003_08465 [Microvirga sp.]